MIITIFIVIALVVSAVALVQKAPEPPATSTPTPEPSITPSTNNSKSNSTTTANPLPSQPSTPPPSTAYVYPGEITQYQGQSLTPVSVYIEYLNQHPEVAIAGVQNIDPAKYKLAITGMVNNVTSYSYDQVVNGFNSTLQVATLPCVEGWSVTMLWQGVPIVELLNQTGIDSGANTLIFLAADGYSSSLPLDYVRQNNIMIAYKMNNVTFTPQLGWPFFLVAKGQYGYKWVEWVTEINVSNDSNYMGYWESRGYPNNATVPNALTMGQVGWGFEAFLMVPAASVPVSNSASTLIMNDKFRITSFVKDDFFDTLPPKQ